MNDDTTGFIEPDRHLKLWSWQYQKAWELGKTLDDVRVMAAIERSIIDPYAAEYNQEVRGSWMLWGSNDVSRGT